MNLTNKLLNLIVRPWIHSRLGWIISPFVVLISYEGRRTGKTFSTPVMYKLHGDTVSVRVAMPDSKRWWRNFVGGGPIRVFMRGRNYVGHAVAVRDGKSVTVNVTLSAAEQAGTDEGSRPVR
jgi:hypothetical protein